LTIHGSGEDGFHPSSGPKKVEGVEFSEKQRFFGIFRFLRIKTRFFKTPVLILVGYAPREFCSLT